MTLAQKHAAIYNYNRRAHFNLEVPEYDRVLGQAVVACKEASKRPDVPKTSCITLVVSYLKDAFEQGSVFSVSSTLLAKLWAKNILQSQIRVLSQTLPC